MKITIPTGDRADMADIAEGLGDLMADLENIRDEAQELLDEKENAETAADIRRMDEAIKKLSEAADLLEQSDE
jgi:phage-related protein